MAVLPAGARERVWAQWMRENAESCAFTKADLRAAVDAVDDWVETNLTSLNLAFPLAFRNTATVAQKAAVLAFVLWRRIGRLQTPEG